MSNLSTINIIREAEKKLPKGITIYHGEKKFLYPTVGRKFICYLIAEKNKKIFKYGVEFDETDDVKNILRIFENSVKNFLEDLKNVDVIA